MRIQLIVPLAVLIALGVGNPAYAQERENPGAQVEKVKYCETYPFGTACYYHHAVFNSTTTPSGNISITSNSRGYGIFDGPNCQNRQEGGGSTHELLVNGEDQQSHITAYDSYFHGCEAFKIRCDTRIVFTYANGEMRVGKRDMDCEIVE